MKIIRENRLDFLKFGLLRKVGFVKFRSQNLKSNQCNIYVTLLTTRKLGLTYAKVRMKNQ